MPFGRAFKHSSAIFITFQAHRNTCTGCSESRPRPPECKTVQRCLQLPNARYPRLQGPIRPLIIPAQAAGNLTRQLSFMHPVHSVASTGHTGDTQDLTTRPLQEISRAAHISSDQLRSAHIRSDQITSDQLTSDSTHPPRSLGHSDSCLQTWPTPHAPAPRTPPRTS